MRIVRSFIPAFALLGGVATAQTPAPVAPLNAIAPPHGAPGSFADETARLSPAVVNVSTTQKVEVGRLPRGLPGGSGLEELFRRFQEQQGEQGEPVTREATSLGSGFIISPDGYIVSNNHVISGGDARGGAAKTPVESITVTLADRREYKARVVGRDPLSDVALLKIDAKEPLPFVQFGDSRGVRVGDWAIAIGNPFGLGGTVTAGIISALHRNIGSGQYDRYIQTDASINQGNSGGPLFDLDGKVIGVNTAIFSPTGGNVGLGFAIPAELVQPVVEQLRTTGTVKRGYLGVGIQPVSANIAASLGLPKDRGEIVAQVEPTGPAARAGVKQGDVITRVAGQEVTFDNTLSFIIANTPIGAKIPIELIRGTDRMTLSAQVVQRPTDLAIAGTPVPDDDNATPDAKAPGAEAARQSLGITLQALTPEVRRQLRVGEAVQGVVIGAVNPSSDAAANGLQRGDVVLSINRQPTTTTAAAAAAVDAARRAGRDTVLMLVQRGATPPLYVGIKLNPGKK